MDMVQILLATFGLAGVLAMVAILFGGPSPAKECARRLQALRARHGDSATSKAEAQMRRALAQRRPPGMPSTGGSSRLDALALRLHRAGQAWSVTRYLQVCAGLGVAVALLVQIQSGLLVLALGLGAAMGAGGPHLAVDYLINRRRRDFMLRFPDAIELLVRGLRSGLPVSETLGVVAAEISGPVGQEFKLVTERTRIGRSMDAALQESAERLDMAEFNFFCVTIAIQRETGGNLAETLANLADVLRKRAQMKLKIRAMSSESKASAYIVGVLPFLVFLMIEWANPLYLAGFWVDPRLIIVGLGGLAWMAIGVFIMARMVSFEI